MRLLGECRGSIDTVKRMGFELKEEEDAVSGLADPSSSESQTSGETTPHPILHAYILHYHTVEFIYMKGNVVAELLSSGIQLW